MGTTENVKHTKFQSPVPLLIRVRNFIFGKKKPDVFTRVTFYINMLIWFMFFLWNIVSYIAISSRNLILDMKGIPVEEIIEVRGVELGIYLGGVCRTYDDVLCHQYYLLGSCALWFDPTLP